jgi:MmyB-like transcription regulator ligand binding domain
VDFPTALKERRSARRVSQLELALRARHVVDNIEAELARNPDDRLATLFAELTDYVPPARLKPGHLGFAVPLKLATSGGDMRLLTTITSFATAVDVTISEPRLEAFLPADEATATLLAKHAERTGAER